LRRRNTSFNTASHVRLALWVYALLVVLVTAASWAIYKHNTAFYLRPLFTAEDQFRDLTNYIDKTAHLYHGSAALGSGYPIYGYPGPTGAYVDKFLIYTFPGHAVRFYLVLLTICISCFAVVAWRAARAGRAVMHSAAAAIVVTAVLGYPLWFCADRGNIEGVVWALAAAGLCFLLRGRYRAAAVLIGLSVSIKPFTILFLFLLVGRRKYKEAALGLVTVVVLVIASLTAMGPTPWKVYQDLKPGASLYLDCYIMDLRPPEEMRFNHSLLDGMKSAALTVEMGGIHRHKAIAEIERLRAEPGGWHVVHPLVRVYPFVAIAGIGLLFAVFYRMPLLNQLTALAVAVTLFPPVAGDYTLLHLYVPFGALLVFLTREVVPGKAAFPYSSMLALAVIYALLFSPLTFLMIYAGDAKLLLLLALLVVAARSPMPSAYFGDPANQDVTREIRAERSMISLLRCASTSAPR
jgi:hypothetical protein